MDKVVHFEIPFDDKARAMKFYSECFGWKLMDMPEMQYVMASSVEVDETQMPKEPGRSTADFSSARKRRRTRPSMSECSPWKQPSRRCRARAARS